MDEIIPVKSDDVDQVAALRAAISGTGLAVQSDDVFGDLAKGSDYLCRIQMCSNKSKLVALNKIQRLHYAYIVNKDTFTDLGTELDVWPITWRPLALDMNGDVPIKAYQPKSQIFMDIAACSEGENSGCTYGPEFMVWVPAIRKFASIHWGSISARIEAPNFKKKMDDGKAVTLTAKTVEGKKWIYDVMVVNACSTPFDLPPQDKTIEQVNKWIAEQTAKPLEAADEAVQTGRAR